jgi:hypothetical protein
MCGKKEGKAHRKNGMLPYDPAKRAVVLRKGIQWEEDCPEEHRPIIEESYRNNGTHSIQKQCKQPSEDMNS